MDNKGLVPLLKSFREIIKNNNVKSIIFVGSSFVCQPFVELFGYSVRDIESYFIPNCEISKAKKLVFDSNEKIIKLDNIKDLPKSDCVVLFGGLAMPKHGVSIDKVKTFLEEMNPKLLIGICFMSVFQKYGWDKEIKFDYLIDGYIEFKIIV